MTAHVATPLQPEAINLLLADHPNRPMAAFIVKGATTGFNNYAGVVEHREPPPTMKSGTEYASVLRKWLEAGAAAGRMGRFPARRPPHPCPRLPPLGGAPKKTTDGSEGGRVVHHLSKDGAYPSVNSCIGDDFTVVYPRVQQAVAILWILGAGAHFSCADIKAGFRNLAWGPQVYHLQATLFENEIWVDYAMGFGSKAPPFSFQTVSEAAAWVIQRRCTEQFGTWEYRGGATPRAWVFVLMDDFIQVAPDAATCDAAFEIMDAVLAEFGPPLQPSKTQRCVQDGEYLGWRLDPLRQRMKLPRDKVVAYRAAVGHLMGGGG